MKITIYSVLPLFSSISLFGFGLLIIQKNFKSIINRTFFLLCASTAFWSFSYSLMYASQTVNQAIFWARVGYLGVIFIPISLYHFTLSFLELKKTKIFFIFLYLSAAVWILISRTDFFINGMHTYFWGFYPKINILYPFWIIFYVGLFAKSIQMLYGAYMSEKYSYKYKQQIKYILLAFFIASFSVVDYLQNFRIPIYPFGYILAFICIPIIAYAIVREKLFDIDLIFHYTFMAVVGSLIGFGVTALVLVVAKLLFPSIFSLSPGVILLSSAIVAFFIFSARSIIDFLYNVSNEYILHHKYDYLKDMPERAGQWTKHIKLGELLKVVEKDFREVLEFEMVKIFLAGDYSIGSHDAAKSFCVINPEDLDDESGPKIPKTSKIIHFIDFQGRTLFLADLKDELKKPQMRQRFKTELAEVIKETEELSAEIIFPVFYYESKIRILVGLVCLGALKGKENKVLSAKFLSNLSKDIETAFRHALATRKLEIVDEKQSGFLRVTIKEMKEQKSEKEKIVEELAQSKQRVKTFTDMASKFATKIQMQDENMEDLNAIMRHADSGVLTVRDGFVKTANRQARRYLAELGETIEGKNFEEVFGTQLKNREQIIEDVKKTVETGRPSRTFETELKTENKNIPVEIKIIPLENPFSPSGVHGALVEIIDISEAKERENLENIQKKFISFRNLMEGLRHELNNAMNILNAYSYAVSSLKEDVLDDPKFKKDFCEIIPQTVRFVTELLDNIAASHVPLTAEGAEPVDVNQISEEVLAGFKERMENSQILTEKKYGQIPKILAVAQQIKDCFYEVIKNSIEAIEELDYERQQGREPKAGGVISIATRVNDGGEVAVSISDNGLGIDEVNLDKVLDPFFTTKVHSVAHSETGTGLGLKKVRNAIQLYGGILKITSKLGEGTTITFSFGLKPKNPEQTLETKEAVCA